MHCTSAGQRLSSSIRSGSRRSRRSRRAAVAPGRSCRRRHSGPAAPLRRRASGRGQNRAASSGVTQPRGRGLVPEGHAAEGSHRRRPAQALPDRRAVALVVAAGLSSQSGGGRRRGADDARRMPARHPGGVKAEIFEDAIGDGHEDEPPRSARQPSAPENDPLARRRRLSAWRSSRRTRPPIPATNPSPSAPSCRKKRRTIWPSASSRRPAWPRARLRPPAGSPRSALKCSGSRRSASAPRKRRSAGSPPPPGPPSRPRGCRRNIVVSFTSDGAALARDLVEREPRRVANLSPRARSAVLSGSAPIRWLYTAETRGRHGGAETTSGNAAQSGPATHAGSGARLVHRRRHADPDAL